MEKNAELVFFSKWLRSPMRVASVTPSGAPLARAMAAAIPDSEGLVVELGGGTGPVTHALLRAGIRPEHLVVIERDPCFHRHLAQRFPDITVLLGDAVEIDTLIAGLATDLPTRAVVSGLPLLPMRAAQQRQILERSLRVTNGLAPFVQFSYGLDSPLKRSVAVDLGLSARCVAQVWRNLPPAKVWRYQRHELSEVRSAS